MSEKPDLSALRINRDQERETFPSGKYLKIALWIIIPVIFIFALLLILNSLSPTVEIKTDIARKLTVNQSQAVLSATGYVVAQRQAAVASKATGRLEYLSAEEGDRVSKGELIGRLENNDMIAALDMSKAQLAQARAESTEAALNYNRQSKLLETGSTTGDVVEIAEAKFKAAAAGVEYAKASVKSSKVALENTYIRAPFDGTVLTKYADLGEIVAPMAASATSQGAIVDLADMKSLEVEADVSESNIQRVEMNQPCEIILDAYPENSYRGYVKKIVPTADRSRATVMTKVAFFDIDNYVLPEMSARVNFLKNETSENAEPEPNTVTVDNKALIMRGGAHALFIVEGDIAREIKVETGRKLGKRTEIISGINVGQKVILSPPSDLQTGDKIEISQ